MPAEFIARWHELCMVNSSVSLSLLVSAEPVKGKCPDPESKDCPTACHSAEKENQTQNQQLRHWTPLSPLPEEGHCKTQPHRNHTKRSKAQSPPLTKSEQKRLDWISGRKSQRCLWISTRTGTTSDRGTIHKSTFVHSWITCSYFLLQSHAYVGLYCLKTWLRRLKLQPSIVLLILTLTFLLLSIICFITVSLTWPNPHWTL